MAGKFIEKGTKLTRHDKYGCNKPGFLWLRGIHIDAIWECGECGQHWQYRRLFDGYSRVYYKKWVSIQKPSSKK